MFNILLVEDDIKLRQLFGTVLTKNGYRTIGAGDGAKALEILDKEYIDIIISDIMMPNMDGYELTKSLRDANMSIPILMISAKESYSDKKQGFLAGTDDYMVKPIDVNEMVLRVGALLRRAKIISEKKLTLNNDMSVRSHFENGSPSLYTTSLKSKTIIVN